jgi:hypothetical protein
VLEVYKFFVLNHGAIVFKGIWKIKSGSKSPLLSYLEDCFTRKVEASTKGAWDICLRFDLILDFLLDVLKLDFARGSCQKLLIKDDVETESVFLDCFEKSDWWVAVKGLVNLSVSRLKKDDILSASKWILLVSCLCLYRLQVFLNSSHQRN